MWVPPEVKEPVLLHHPTGKVLDTLEQYESEMESLFTKEKKICLMAIRFGIFLNDSVWPVAMPKERFT